MITNKQDFIIRARDINGELVKKGRKASSPDYFINDREREEWLPNRSAERNKFERTKRL